MNNRRTIGLVYQLGWPSRFRFGVFFAGCLRATFLALRGRYAADVAQRLVSQIRWVSNIE